MYDLSGKSIIVTGAAQGIGRACASRAIELGANVLAVDSDRDMLKNLMECDNSRLLPFVANVDDDDHRKKIVEEAISQFGDCNVLVNNAARFLMSDISAVDADWIDCFRTNVIAPARLTYWVDRLTAQNGTTRSIINIASISGVCAQPGFATYNASKGALITLTKCMALDLAERGFRVNSVSPGTTWTNSNEIHIRRKYNVGRKGADAHPDLGGKHVLGRLADAVEIANVVCFLASDEASFVTGANYFVDGGYSIV